MSQNGNLPSLHMIPYPERFGSRPEDSGASSFRGKVNHPDSRYYVFNDYYNMESDETLHILPHFETYLQTTDYTCGAASALMVLNYLGQKRYNEEILGGLMEVDPHSGTSVENMAEFFDVIGWQVWCHAATQARWDTVEELEASLISLLDQGIPVMVDWLDWDGHWSVIIGLDTCGTETAFDDVLIFADPYDVTSHFQDGYSIFPLAKFFNMWREGGCTGKTEPYVQPFIIALPPERKPISEPALGQDRI